MVTRTLYHLIIVLTLSSAATPTLAASVTSRVNDLEAQMREQQQRADLLELRLKRLEKQMQDYGLMKRRDSDAANGGGSPFSFP